MKIHILYKLKTEATGGGNQFLNCLKKYLINNEYYTDVINKADVILFNSHHFINDVLKIKREYNNKLFIHRVDGPIKLYNDKSDKRDNIVYIVNKLIADGTVFQSNWVKENNYRMGLIKNKYTKVILNTADNEIFNRKDKIKFSDKRKIKIIAASWSDNINKGFDIYKWLDENLDFKKYEMTFIGRSPLKFNMIKMVPPQNSYGLSKILKKHDIYITASKNDPCSNSLIEALSCGLPAIALNSGGHPEIVKKGGELFNHKEEILTLLEKVSRNYSNYIAGISIPSINQIGCKYVKFINEIFLKFKQGYYYSKKISMFDYIKISKILLSWKINLKLRKYIQGRII